MLARKALAGTAGAPKVYVEDVFSTYLYAGGTTTQTITNGIDLSTKGGMVWIKSRASTYNHSIWDSSRAGKYLFVNQADAQTSAAYVNFLTTGFTVTANDGFGYESPYGGPYVSWTFAEQAKFFDVVTYTGNGANRTISHNLGSVPGCIIVKRTDSAADWQVYHRSLANTEYLVLNTSAAKATGTTRWNSTTPTSTEFSLGTDTTVNANSGTYVAYLFAHDAGGFGDAGSDNVISCGSCLGNATVDLGWEPQFLMVKASSTTGNWEILDNMRGFTVAGQVDARLRANLSDAEVSSDVAAPTATGFTLDFSGATTYVYIAIRRGPMKTPETGTSVYSVFADGASTNPKTFSAGFPTDFAISQVRSTGAASYNYAGSRLTGNSQYLVPQTTGAEQADTTPIWTFDLQNSFKQNISAASMVSWLFRRAPGFFDVVCYTGNGSTQNVSHNLGVVPELMIVKSRSLSGSDWWVYASALTTPQNKYLRLQSTDGESTATGLWGSSLPTSTTFGLGAFAPNSSGETFVAYLFATCAGVSKVGSYTGNGSSVTVTTDFQPRFILVKRTDSTGNWIVSDSARGLPTGNDPALFLNSTAAETTGQDWVDVSSTSFTVNETALNANVNTATYLYFAVA